MSQEALEQEVVEATSVPDFLVEPMACPYRAIIKVSYDSLREKFDTFWGTNGSFIVEKVGYKGKKHKGGLVDLVEAKTYLESHLGVNKLYRQVLVELALTYLTEKYEEVGSKPMFIERINLNSVFAPDQELYVLCIFYFWPKLMYSGDPLTFNFVRPRSRSGEAETERRLKQIASQFPVIASVEGDDITSEMEVLYDVIASVNSEPYEEGTLRKQWNSVAQIESPALKDALLSHKKGDLFECSFTHKDVDITAHIKIYDTRIVKERDLDDPELYVLAKLGDRESYTKRVCDEFATYMDQVEAQTGFDDVLNGLTLNSTIEPIPQKWIDLNTDHMKNEHIAKNGGDKEKALRVLNVENEEKLIQLFEQHVLRSAITQMAVNYYSYEYKVEATAEAVAKDIKDRATWSDPA